MHSIVPTNYILRDLIIPSCFTSQRFILHEIRPRSTFRVTDQALISGTNLHQLSGFKHFALLLMKSAFKTLCLTSETGALSTIYERL
jgi:hypothetical protein